MSNNETANLYSAFTSLTEGSRLWVFPLQRSLAESDPKLLELKKRLTSFLKNWEAHGAEVAGALEVVYGRFVLVAADKGSATVSGCSIDSLFRAVRDELASGGDEMADLSDIFFLKDDLVRQMSRSEFAEFVKTDDFSPDLMVFDTTVESIDRLSEFTRPFADSWHARLFSNVSPSVSSAVS
jgi:hypothetical protein